MLRLKKKSLSSKTHSGFSELLKKFICVGRNTACVFLLFLFLSLCVIYVTEAKCLNTMFDFPTQTHNTLLNFVFSTLYVHICIFVIQFFLFSFLSFYELSRLNYDCSSSTFILVFNLQLKNTPQKMDMEWYEEALIPAE